MDIDADGISPANGDERNHVSNLLETVAVKTGKAGRPRKNVRRLAADKGYDADALRNFLKKKGIQPQIPRKRGGGPNRLMAPVCLFNNR